MRVGLFALAGFLPLAFAVFGEQVRTIAVKEKELPMTINDLQTAGWSQSSIPCDPEFGIAYHKSGDAPTKEHPQTVFMTANGQFAGVGMTYFNYTNVDGKNSYVFQEWIDWGLVQPMGQGWILRAITRDFGVGVGQIEACATGGERRQAETIGDRVCIPKSVGGSNEPICLPANSTEAADKNWVKGACVLKMGTHWWNDIDCVKGGPCDGGLSWKTGNLFPLVPMYAETDNSLNAFFFVAPGGQGAQQYFIDSLQTLPQAGLEVMFSDLGTYRSNGMDYWGFNMPLNNFEYGPTICGNMCEPCYFPDTPETTWQIMHVYLKDDIATNLDYQCTGTDLQNGVVCADQAQNQYDIGDRISTIFMLFQGQPTTATAALAAGWYKSGSACDDYLGWAYTKDASGPTVRWPMTLYYTENGYFAGFGMEYYSASATPGYEAYTGGYVSQNLIDGGYLRTTDTADQYHLSISTRVPADMCSTLATNPDGYDLGYQMVMNQGTDEAIVLPLTRRLAKAGGWLQGSCSARMGEHWWMDITGTSTTIKEEMSWSGDNVFPLVLMYDEVGGVANADGGLTGFFFAAPGGQLQHGNFGQTYDLTLCATDPTKCQYGFTSQSDEEWQWQFPWNTIRDPSGILPSVCGNQCNSYCDFPDIPGKFWQVNHVLFWDYNTVTCDPDGFAREGGSVCEADYSVSGYDDHRSITGTNVVGEWVHLEAYRYDGLIFETDLSKYSNVAGSPCPCEAGFYCSYNYNGDYSLGGTCLTEGVVGDYCNEIKSCGWGLVCTDNECQQIELF